MTIGEECYYYTMLCRACYCHDKLSVMCPSVRPWRWDVVVT